MLANSYNFFKEWNFLIFFFFYFTMACESRRVLAATTEDSVTLAGHGEKK